MKRLILSAMILLTSLTAIAQTRVPAKMVKFDTSGFTWLTNDNLQTALATLDTAPGSAINYAPRLASTNTAITSITPRWIGDVEILYGTSGTNIQVWQSYGITTSSWTMIYPPVGRHSTSDTTTNTGPYVAGEFLQINGATNILWRSFANTNGVLSWKCIYRGIP